MATIRSRVYCPLRLAAGAAVPLDDDEFWHLIRVKRHRPGDRLHVFNAEDGAFAGVLTALSRSTGEIILEERIAPPPPPPDPALHLRMAPIRRHLLRDVVQAAVALGIASFGTVITRYARREPEERRKWLQIAIAATEQCGGFHLPAFAEQQPLAAVLQNKACLVAAEFEPAAVFSPPATGSEFTLLIGPEGGFSDEERSMIQASPVTCLSLGDRLLRAETAAVTMVALMRFRAPSPL